MEPHAIPPSTKLDLCDYNAELFGKCSQWLKKHGKVGRSQATTAVPKQESIRQAQMVVQTM